jgi:excinuclease ABC subunit C
VSRFWEWGARDEISRQRIGRSNVFPLRRRFRALAIDCEPAAVRRRIRAACPPSPGVYGFVDHAGALIYVGVSSKLRSRLVAYFQGGANDRKEGAVASQSNRVMWQVVGHEFAAQLRELELIRRYQPRLNVRGRWPDRPLGYLYLSAETAPRFRVAREVPKAARHWWGPLPIGSRIRSAVDTVNRLFQLPDCPASVAMHFADERPLFPLDLRLGCLRGETGSCLAPCAGGCTRFAYARQTAAARALLDGRDDSTIRELEQRLAAAVADLRFEQAASLRDTLDSVNLLVGQLAKLREPPTPEAFVYPVEIGRHAIWYYIAGGVAVAASLAPTSREDAGRCLAHWERTYRGRVTPGRETDRAAALIVTAWFHLRPEEAAKIIPPQAARRQCKKLLVA